MGSIEIRAEMKHVREAMRCITAARKHVNSTFSDANNIVRGADGASQSVTRLIGGASTGADRKVISRLNHAAEGGKKFKRELGDILSLMQSRTAQLQDRLARLERDLDAAYEREAAMRAASRSRY